MILIAPDKFKGSLTAREVCRAIEKGLRRWNSEIPIVCHPLADGGEGSLEVLDAVLDLEDIEIEILDPLFRPIKAVYKIGQGVAYIEMARASGLELLGAEERNPLKTTSYGTGQLIVDATRRGAKKIYLFAGGSATNDAGLGMAEALGYCFLNKGGEKLKPTGENLDQLHRIDSSGLLFDRSDLEMTIVADVQNPLYGPSGAAWVYAAQKGADTEAIEILDKGLRKFAKVAENTFDIDLSTIAGAGAAGGLAAGAIAFCGAELRPGIETILNITHFEKHLDNVDLIITGEGQIDRQSLDGKLIKGLCDLAKMWNIPVVAVCGSLQLNKIELEDLGLVGTAAILQEGVSLRQAMEEAAARIEDLAYELLESGLA